MDNKDYSRVDAVDFHLLKRQIHEYASNQMHLEDAMPLSLAVNVFSWNAPPDNKPMIDCEDIDVYFELVDQHNTNQDESL